MDYLTASFLLILVGLVLLAAEFFLPTGGLLVVGGIVALAAAIGIVWWEGSAWEGAAVTLAVCVGIPVVAWQLVSAYEKHLVSPLLHSETVTTTFASLPEIAELEKLRGRYGKTITPMRPAGTVEIDGRRIDAQSEGIMIDSGKWVKCVDVRAGKVIVREEGQPPDLSEMPITELG